MLHDLLGLDNYGCDGCESCQYWEGDAHLCSCGQNPMEFDERTKGCCVKIGVKEKANSPPMMGKVIFRISVELRLAT